MAEIEKLGDVDFFKFAAKQARCGKSNAMRGESARRLILVINIYNADQGHLAGNDDARGQDSLFSLASCRPTATTILRINDHFGQAGDTYVYRVEMSPVTPSLKLGIPRSRSLLANSPDDCRPAR